jgi:hypothetical protein
MAFERNMLSASSGSPEPVKMGGGCYTETLIFTCMYGVTDCEAIQHENLVFRSVL